MFRVNPDLRYLAIDSDDGCGCLYLLHSIRPLSPLPHPVCVCVMGADFCTKFPPDCGGYIKNGEKKEFNHSSSCKLYFGSREKLIQEGGRNDDDNTG